MVHTFPGRRNEIRKRLYSLLPIFSQCAMKRSQCMRSERKEIMSAHALQCDWPALHSDRSGETMIIEIWYWGRPRSHEVMMAVVQNSFVKGLNINGRATQDQNLSTMNVLLWRRVTHSTWYVDERKLEYKRTPTSAQGRPHSCLTRGS